MQFKRAPVDQILFLCNCTSTKLRSCGTLVTSDHGQAGFWDLFGPDEPLGSFPLTQNPEEQVVALSTVSCFSILHYLAIELLIMYVYSYYDMTNCIMLKGLTMCSWTFTLLFSYGACWVLDQYSL